MEEKRKTVDLQLQKQLEEGLNALRSDVGERPFLYLTVAFLGGFVCNTLPVRFLLMIVLRIASWLLGPAILLMGLIKLTDLFSSSRPGEPKLVQRP
jgi:hypothetical protein